MDMSQIAAQQAAERQEQMNRQILAEMMRMTKAFEELKAVVEQHDCSARKAKPKE